MTTLLQPPTGDLRTSLTAVLRDLGSPEPIGGTDSGCTFVCPNCNQYSQCSDQYCPIACRGASGCSDNSTQGCCLSGYLCGCRNCSIDTGCFRNAGTASDAVTISTASRVELDSCPYTLDRVEPDYKGELFLMEEWAILTFRAEADGTPADIGIADGSTLAFAEIKADCLARSPVALELGSGTAQQALLVVDHPIHPMNERHIPMPGVGLRPGSLPHDGPVAQAVVRFDVDRQRQFRGVDLLYASGELPEGFLDHVREHLDIRYQTDRTHRLIVFGVFELGNGQVRLREARPVLPECCCPTFPVCPV